MYISNSGPSFPCPSSQHGFHEKTRDVNSALLSRGSGQAAALAVFVSVWQIVDARRSFADSEQAWPLCRASIRTRPIAAMHGFVIRALAMFGSALHRGERWDLPCRRGRPEAAWILQVGAQ